MHPDRTADTALATRKALAVRWLDLVSAHDLDGLCAITADEWTMFGGPPGMPRGAAAVRHLFDAIGPVRQTWVVDDVIAEGDRVVVRATDTCEQESFFGVPGRGVTQVFTATFTFLIRDGLVVTTWRNADDLGRLFQLGARVVPGAA